MTPPTTAPPTTPTELPPVRTAPPTDTGADHGTHHQAKQQNHCCRIPFTADFCIVFILNTSALNIRCRGKLLPGGLFAVVLLCLVHTNFLGIARHCIEFFFRHRIIRVTLISRCVTARFAAFFFRLHTRRRGLLVGYNYCFEVFSCALASDLAPARAAFASFTQTSLSLPTLSSHFSLATE